MGICDGCIRCPKNYYEKKALSDSVSPYEKELANENTYREQYSILSSESRISNDIEELQLKQKYLVQKNEKSPYEIYNLVKTIGEGSFGKAQLITLKSNPNIQKVLKVLPKKYLNKNLKNISSEIEILRRLDHPYILSIYEFFEDESNFYFVNDYFPDGDLASQFEKNGIFTELSVKYILYQLLQAVTYLHENNVMHGDIKLENILIENINYCDSMEDCSNMPINIESNPPARKKRRFSYVNKIIKKHTKDNFKRLDNLRETMNNEKTQQNPELLIKKRIPKLKLEDDVIYELGNFNIKLIDFGCSKIVKKNCKLSAIIGSNYYCSPEVVKNLYNDKSDEWSCGVAAYFLLYGKFPFDGNTEEELFSAILNDPLEFPSYKYNSFNNQNITEQCKDLLMKLINKNLEERLSAKDALNHPFFDDIILDSLNHTLDHKEEYKITTKMYNLKTPKTKPSIFKNYVQSYLTKHYLEKKEENRLKKIFYDIDTSKTFMITKEDFISYYQKNDPNNHRTEEDLIELFNSIDTDKSGQIDFHEFLTVMADPQNLYTEDNLKGAFDFFDKNNSNSINTKEALNIIYPGQYNSKVEQIVNDSLQVIGKKLGDDINFEEFKELISHKEF